MDTIFLRSVIPIISLRYVFSDGEPPSCVSHPKLVADSTNEMSIHYNDIIQKNDSSATLTIEILKNFKSGQ